MRTPTMAPGGAPFRRAALALAATLLAGSMGVVRAAELRPVPGDPGGAACGGGATVALTGTIVAGDADRLRALLDGLLPPAPARPHGVRGWLSLDSPGGNLLEGIALADYLRESSIGTRVEEGARCASACAIAFMGGAATDGAGDRVPMRRLHPRGELAFHAPDLPAAAYARIAPGDLDAARRVEGLMVTAARGFARIMRDHDWSPSLTRAALARTGSDFETVDTVDEAGRWRIEVMHDARLRLPGVRAHGDAPRWSPGAAAWCLNRVPWSVDASAVEAVRDGFDYELERPGPTPDWEAARLREVDPSDMARLAIHATPSGDSYRRWLVARSADGFGGPAEMAGNYCPIATDGEGRIVGTDDNRLGGEGLDRIRAWQALPPDTRLRDIDGALAATGIFGTAAPDGPEPFTVRRETLDWDHNGSGMQTHEEVLSSGEERVRIVYEKPKDSFAPGLIPPGTVLFRGRREGGEVVGDAHRFRIACDAPLPYGVRGALPEDADAFTLRGRTQVIERGTCNVTGWTREGGAAVLEFVRVRNSWGGNEPDVGTVTLTCPHD